MDFLMFQIKRQWHSTHQSFNSKPCKPSNFGFFYAFETEMKVRNAFNYNRLFRFNIFLGEDIINIGKEEVKKFEN